MLWGDRRPDWAPQVSSCYHAIYNNRQMVTRRLSSSVFYLVFSFHYLRYQPGHRQGKATSSNDSVLNTTGFAANVFPTTYHFLPPPRKPPTTGEKGHHEPQWLRSKPSFTPSEIQVNWKSKVQTETTFAFHKHCCDYSNSHFTTSSGEGTLNTTEITDKSPKSLPWKRNRSYFTLKVQSSH